MSRTCLELLGIVLGGASTFDICEHQPLKAMMGPPLKIRVKEGAEPVALHQPIPLPHHWRQQVFEGLKRDCKLGVIRRVPAGNPTTWYSRMAVTAKADGFSWRTVDLQALNKVSSRETHHILSPLKNLFLQMGVPVELATDGRPSLQRTILVSSVGSGGSGIGSRQAINHS